MTSTRAGPVVVKIGGSVLDEQFHAPEVWGALALLHAQRRAIVVHGGGKALDRQLARLGAQTERRNGLRVTPTEQIADVVSVLAGDVNTSVVGALLRAGAAPVGLTLGDGPIVACERILEPDLGRVGRTCPAVPGPGARILHALLDAGALPVVSCIGLDAQGAPLNINADEAAAGVAQVVGASCLILLTDVPGVRGADGKIVHRLDGAEAARLIGLGVIGGGMIPKVESALAVARSLGAPVVILSGSSPRALVDWAQGHRTGTEIVAGFSTSNLSGGAV